MDCEICHSYYDKELRHKGNYCEACEQSFDTICDDCICYCDTHEIEICCDCYAKNHNNCGK